jgi:hypothetical protein
MRNHHPPRPVAQVVEPFLHALLRDLYQLTSRLFIYEDPWHGFVPLDGAPTDCQIGLPVSFASLSRQDEADVLDTFIRWEPYRQQGLKPLDEYAITQNVTSGKPRQRWLERTSFQEPAGRDSPAGHAKSRDIER